MSRFHLAHFHAEPNSDLTSEPFSDRLLEHAYDQLLGQLSELADRYNALLGQVERVDQTVQQKDACIAELEQQVRQKDQVIDRLTRSSDEDFDRTLSLLEELDGLRKEVERLRSQQG